MNHDQGTRMTRKPMWIALRHSIPSNARGLEGVECQAIDNVGTCDWQYGRMPFAFKNRSLLGRGARLVPRARVGPHFAGGFLPGNNCA